MMPTTVSTGSIDRAVKGLQREDSFLQRAAELVAGAQFDDIEQVAAEQFHIADPALGIGEVDDDLGAAPAATVFRSTDSFRLLTILRAGFLRWRRPCAGA